MASTWSRTPSSSSGAGRLGLRKKLGESLSLVHDLRALSGRPLLFNGGGGFPGILKMPSSIGVSISIFS